MALGDHTVTCKLNAALKAAFGQAKKPYEPDTAFVLEAVQLLVARRLGVRVSKDWMPVHKKPGRKS